LTPEVQISELQENTNGGGEAWIKKKPRKSSKRPMAKPPGNRRAAGAADLTPHNMPNPSDIPTRSSRAFRMNQI
jgi:hypothetical protein